MQFNGSWVKWFLGIIFTGGIAWLTAMSADITGIKHSLEEKTTIQGEKIAKLEERAIFTNHTLEKIDLKIDKLTDKIELLRFMSF